jgi:alanyl-tRNA synthetase
MKSKGHAEIVNSSLVPENDPSVLFVNSGMFPLVPFLLGEKHPLGTRLTNVQRSVRTGDIDDVGDATHCTAFEMLGNWSLNDYFKKEAIEQIVEFFVEILGLDIHKVHGTIFAGTDGVPKDTDSLEIWKNLFKKYGIEAKVGPHEYITELSDNWWGLAGGGPCGPDSEVFYDTGKEICGPDCHVGCDCNKYVEIGNNVLMQYLLKDGKLEPLGRHNVDFGGGLERIVTMLQGVGSFYDTDIYKPILDFVKSKATAENLKSERIVVDHIKSATWIIMDGVVPGRSQQSYILRRLIRRAVRHAKVLGIEGLFTRGVGQVCINQFSPIYPELKTKETEILNILEEEEIKFNRTLKDGLKEVEKLIKSLNGVEFKNTNGESFKIYETYGFPMEMLIEELKSNKVKINEKELEENHLKAMEEHQEKSRTSSKGMFKGGMADTSEMSTKYHTATHLLNAALRKIVGTHIYQKGSNITPERLRFDFPNEAKLTDEQLLQVENLINEQIQKGLDVSMVEMDKESALKLVPFAAFEGKYGDIVKVYTIGSNDNPFSQELCNGPHVKNTSELGHFKIVKQENLGAGIKRIKAILE